MGIISLPAIYTNYYSGANVRSQFLIHFLSWNLYKFDSSCESENKSEIALIFGIV